MHSWGFFSPTQCRMLKFLRTARMPNVGLTAFPLQRGKSATLSTVAHAVLLSGAHMGRAVASTGPRICNLPWEPRTKLANSSTSRRDGLGKTLEPNWLEPKLLRLRSMIMMMIDTIKIRGPIMLRRGSRTASSAKRKSTFMYRSGSNTSR